jgi:PhnB protein
MEINAYLNFDGTCAEAFAMTAKVLGGKITGTHLFGDMPGGEPMPEGMKKRVMHISLVAEGQILMGSDCPPGKSERVGGFSVSVNIADEARAARVFAGLAEGGKVEMAFQKTFFSKGFGMCRDRFGIPWMVNSQG